MSKATAKNEIQVVLEEYLGNGKAEKVAEAVYEVIQAKTQYTHNGKRFFINEDSNGALVLTMESIVKEHVETILSHNLKEDEVKECLEQLMLRIISTAKEIKTISVEGSDSQIYSDILKHNPDNPAEKSFLMNLKEAVDAGVKNFKVPVYDPSIDENGSLQFVAGRKPAVGYSYNQLEKLAIKSGVQLGSKHQYELFLATIIHRLVEEGWREEDAFFSVCMDVDGRKARHSPNPAKAKKYFELTGLRAVAGKFDFDTTSKILAKDEEAGGFWLAGAILFNFHLFLGMSGFNLEKDYDKHYDTCVGWFVL